MSLLKQKRFWKTAAVVERDAGFGVELDGRPVNTPNKTPLVVPTIVMAQAIAVEWDAQVDKIDPLTMPVTRGANSAIDKVAPQQPEVVADLANYGDSDLLCYRAAGPAELVARQAEKWDPVLDWAADVFGARLNVGEGVMHVAQDAALLQKLHAEVAEFTNFELAGVHDLIAISGSLILALSVTRQAMAAEAAWLLSRLDEHWQVELWGADEEAAEHEALKRAAFLNAARFYEMSVT